MAGACTFVHQSMETMCERYHRELRRHIYVTPKSYLNLVVTYMQLLTAKRGELSYSRTRCMTGVTKIEDSNALVGRLKVQYHVNIGELLLHCICHSMSCVNDVLLRNFIVAINHVIYPPVMFRSFSDLIQHSLDAELHDRRLS